MKEKTKLNLDIEALFPFSLFKIGEQEIKIYPLDISQIAYMLKKFNTLIPTLQNKGISFENYNQPENIISLVGLILDEAPEILAEASNIELESIKQLPLEYSIDLLSVIIDINLKSKSSLMGNFSTLSTKVMSLLPPEPKKKKKK